MTEIAGQLETRTGVPQQKGLTRLERQEQEVQQRPLDLGLIRRLLSFTRPYKWRRNTLMCLVLIRAVQLPAMAWVLSQVFNGPIAHKDYRGTLLWTVAFAGLAVVTYITFAFRLRLAMELGEWVVHDLRFAIFQKLQRMSMRYYDRTKLGRIISRMTSDVESVRTGVQDVLFMTMVQTGQMLVAAGFMLWVDPGLFGMLLVLAPIIWIITRYFRSQFSEAYRNMRESFSRVTATLAESVSGIRVTQSFVRQDVNASLFRDLVIDHSGYSLRTIRLAGSYLPLLELNSQFFISMLLALGGCQVLLHSFFAPGDAQQSFSAVWPFFFMAPLFFQPVTSLGQQYNTAMTAMAGAERVFRLLDSEPEQLDADDAADLPPIEGRVQFKNMTFGYDPQQPILHEINFVAEPGRTVALVGHTGSGKSSIINLIAKFYLPTAGKVLIDGHDTFHVRTTSLAQQLGIVLQTNFLFSGTVMDNIRVGNAEATDAQVIEAARRLDCLDLFEQLPSGFYTDVGERGGNLSLGQRQLVCFTRAMLADPRILILDEATSAVDTMTEARIQRALSVLLRNRTSFVVAHRLSTIRHADVVLVLDHGRIIERGAHTELLATGGVYSNLYRQFIHASEA